MYGTLIEDQFVAVFNWPLGAALSFILLGVCLWLLRTGGRALYAIPFLIALWVNLDDWFILGPMVVAIAVGCVSLAWKPVRRTPLGNAAPMPCTTFVHETSVPSSCCISACSAATSFALAWIGASFVISDCTLAVCATACAFFDFSEDTP